MKEIPKESKFTPKKQILKYKESPHDPITSIIERSKPLPPNIASHLEAVYEWLIEDAKEVREEDKRQEELPMDEDPEPEEEAEQVESSDDEDEVEEVAVPEEPAIITESDGADDEPPAEEEPVDYANEPLPVFENSEMPEFSKMTKEHLVWYINNSEQDTIIEDIRWNFKLNLNPGKDIGALRQHAIDVAFDQLKIK